MKTNYQVDLNFILNKIKNNRYHVLKIYLFFLFIGLLLFLLFPYKYKSNTTFALQINNESTTQSTFGGLASLAGINLNQNLNYVSPTIYPKIIESYDFKRKILNVELNDSLTLKNFLISKLSLNKSKFLNNSFVNNINIISKDELILYDYLESIISFSSNISDNIYDIIVEMENPLYSSVIALKSREILQSKIIDFNIKSSKDELDFVKKNYNLKKIELEKIQDELAKFNDKNKVISTSIFSNERMKLESKYETSYRVFQELSIELEQSKLKLNRNTPIFTVVKEVSVPIIPSSFSLINYLLLYSLIGFIVAIFYIFLKNDLYLFLKKIKD